MQYFLKRLSDGALLPTAQLPVWLGGIWNGGNERWQDQQGTAYVPWQIAGQQELSVQAQANYTAMLQKKAALLGRTDPYAATQLLLKSKGL